MNKMNKQRVLDDFQYIKEFLEELEWTAEVVGQDTEIPTLIARFPLEEDYEETVVCHYLSLPEEDVEYSKLLQCYCHIPLELSEIPAGELMVLVNHINLLTTVGYFIYQPSKGEQSHQVALRYVWSMPEHELPEDGVLGEVMLLLLHYGQIMEGLLIRRLAGTAMDLLLAEVSAGL